MTTTEPYDIDPATMTTDYFGQREASKFWQTWEANENALALAEFDEAVAAGLIDLYITER